MSWQLTQIILLEFADSESFSLMADCNVWYRGATAPCPAVSRILQLPRIKPFGIPFFFIYSLKLLTIVSVGFSETPWNFLNPVTWIVTAGGPSDPITNNCLEMKYGNVLWHENWNQCLSTCMRKHKHISLVIQPQKDGQKTIIMKYEFTTSVNKNCSHPRISTALMHKKLH